MAKVTLKKLDTWRDWLPLRFVHVTPEQRRFTSNIVISYLQSTHPAVTTYALYVQETLIGYVMLIHSQDPTQWIIERLTIDKNHQRKGYGYDAADQLIDMVHGFQKSEMVVVRYDPDNEPARQLFAKLKFEEQDKMFKKRHIALLEFEFDEIEAEEDDELLEEDADEIVADDEDSDKDSDDWDDEEYDDEDDWDEEEEDQADSVDPETDNNTPKA